MVHLAACPSGLAGPCCGTVLVGTVLVGTVLVGTAPAAVAGNVAGVSRIYHITTRADWARAEADGVYTRSTVDKTLAEVGFIHASQASQVTGTANKFYRTVTGALVVLVIETDRVRAEVRYEQVPGAELPFPHIYGPLNADAVVDLLPLEPGPDGAFEFDAGAR
jgi:glutathione S-transferase